MESHLVDREKIIIDTAFSILQLILTSENERMRVSGDAPFHLDVASVIYAMAMQNCINSGEHIESLIDHANQTGYNVYDIVNTGRIARENSKLSAN
jgi:hypothetical protein